MASLCRSEEFTGKAEFFDRLGLATAVDKTGRNTDTPNLDIAHSRRMVTTVTREWGTLVDRKDKVQNIHNPENEYSVAAQNALGRKMDSIIIDAALAAARTGEDGAGTQTLGNLQKVASVASAAIDYANVQVLRKAKLIMDRNEVMGQRVLVHGADFLESLLAATAVTSSDFNTVKALVMGEVDTFLGFKFIHSEIVSGLLAASYDADTFLYNTTTGLYEAAATAVGATNKVAIAMVCDGIILGKNPNSIARVSEREDKSYSTQVYASIDCGATRMEEAKVVQIIYKA